MYYEYSIVRVFKDGPVIGSIVFIGRDMRVFLSLDASLDGLSDVGGIVAILHPEHDKWNDFDFRLYATLTIYRSGIRIWSNSMRMFVEGEPQTTEWFSSELENNSLSLLPLQKVRRRFITAQLDKLNYVKLRKALDLDLAEELLTLIHDLPNLRTNHKGHSDLELTRVKEFVFGFVRTRESYLISESDVRRLLLGAPQDDVLAGVKAFWASYECLSTSELVKLVFDCSKNALEKNRIAVLVGVNGIGKTSALVESANIVCNSIASDVEDGREIRHLREVGFHRVVFATSTHHPSPLPDAVRKVKLGTDAGQDLERTRSISTIARNKEGLTLAYLRKVLTEAIENFDIEIPMNQGGFSLARSFSGERDRLDFCANIDIMKPLRFVDEKGLPRRLSSGEECLVDIALLISAQVIPNSLLLVDEMENSMHPKFITAGISILRAVLASQNSFCILATHSALVVREVESLSVHILQRQDLDIKIYRPMLQTFGESVGLINDIIFDDRSSGKSYEKVIHDAVDNSLDAVQFDKDVQALLGVNALSYYKKIKYAS